MPRKSASKQAGGGGAPRPPNPQPTKANRSANTGNRDYHSSSIIHLHRTNVFSAGKASSKPPTSSNHPPGISAQTRKSSIPTPPKTRRTDVYPGAPPKPPSQPQVAANRSSNGTKCKPLASTLSTTHVLHLSSRYQ